MKDGFNAQRDTIVELGVTHMLFHDGGDNAKNIFAVKFAAELAHAKRLASYPFRGLTLQLFALEGPLPRIDTSPSLPHIQLHFSGVRH